MKPYHFKEIHNKGYSADMIYILTYLSENEGVDLNESFDSKKIQMIINSMILKGLITLDFKLTIPGKDLLSFISSDEETKFVKTKPKEDFFDSWWKTYPGTDSFSYKGVSFQGSRSLRVKKDDCKIKLKKILDEGDYTIEDLVKALELEVQQKKEASVKQRSNKLSFMQNSLTYLNQRTFEPFIELIKKEGSAINKPEPSIGGIDI
jgi:hypothetical protein